MAATGVHFYRVKIEQLVLNMATIRRQAGLEMMMGSAAALAHALGPDEDLATSMAIRTVLICADCSLQPQIPAVLIMEDQP